MFGLTFEKLLLLAIIAGVILGPHNLPIYAQKLAETVRALRAFIDMTRTTAEKEMGIPLQRADWQSLNLRQYDPRLIVREALDEADSTATSPVAGTESSREVERAETGADLAEQASRVRPGQKFITTGSAAHPVRLPIDSLPLDDPRRIAAYGTNLVDEPEHVEV
ncbi:preprotein translocase [Dietzia sp. MNB45]|uniref:preprotein translocase n=1 Tax=Dietzia sp. MNB45 TaxID=3238800 RepID=UPI003F7DBBBC